MASRRPRPRREDFEKKQEHSREHKQATGRFGSYWKKTPDNLWGKVSVGDHELCVIPYYVTSEENSIWRTGNPELNKPFTKEEIEEGRFYDYKLGLLTHSNIGVNEDTVVCLQTFRETCPICVYRRKLQLEDADEYEDVISMLSQRRVCLYNIVVFDTDLDISEGVKIWAAPYKSIEGELVDRQIDRRTGEKKIYGFPEEGYNVVFTKSGTKMTDTKYSGIDIVPRREEDDFTEEELDELYDMATDFEDAIEILDYSTLQEMLEGTVLPDGLPERAGEEENGRPSRRSRKSDEDSPRKGGRSRFRGKREEYESRDEDKEQEPEEEKEDEEKEEVSSENYTTDDPPDCFGVSNQQLDECQDCAIWDDCYDEQKKATKVGKKSSNKKQGGKKTNRKSTGKRQSRFGKK